MRMSPSHSCPPMLHRFAAVLSVAAAPALAAEPTLLERPLAVGADADNTRTQSLAFVGELALQP